MVENIGLHTLVGNPILDRRKEIKLNGQAVVGGLQMAHHAVQFLIHHGQALEVSGEVGAEYTKICLPAAVHQHLVVDAVLFVVGVNTASVWSM